MSNNKSYRIRTEVGSTSNNVLNVQINNDYDILEILSLKFETENMYKLHTSKYGCVVGRVLANGGVGVPNAKISIFIEVDEETTADDVLYNIYPYTTTSDKNSDGIRYNLLPDEQVAQCHQAVGTMPNKRLVLDDKNTLEIFDKYYKYTTVTNGAGDYMIMGVPVGNQTLHMDVDLSDIGFLSQKPVDMVYKGYNITQFENPSMFKKDTNLNNLTQIISQDTTVYVNPFWGDEDLGETISITRHDIDVNYKFEPTCIFMGSIATETSSNGFSKKCVPTPKMGRMDELTTGSGTIEMIRLRPDGDIESFNINGTELIDGNGVWCYQIPMNLDYVTTDEYGNIIPTDNPEKGIATRTKVRFRVSINDFESDYSNNHFVKILVPNNPEVGPKIKEDGTEYENLYELKTDYTFGSSTDKDNSFKDLFWNNVYTVKSFIPRIQKGHYQRSLKFSGIKNVNVHGKNNPIPYNNMRVNITFMFILQCAIIKALLWVIKVYNQFLHKIGDIGSIAEHMYDKRPSCLYVGDGLCPDLDGWYFAPGCENQYNNKQSDRKLNFHQYTLDKIRGGDAGSTQDPNSTDAKNSESDAFCVSWDNKPNYLIQCIEINLAMENEVIQFDFYNDWINGLIYIPRWFVKIRKKGSFFFGLIPVKFKVTACNNKFGGSRHYVQQCAMEYENNGTTGNAIFSKNVSKRGCKNNTKYKCHKSKGRKHRKILRGGLVVEQENKNVANEKGQFQKAYYAKPAELFDGSKKCNLFATDIVLLGSINPNNLWGIPSEFSGLTSSTFQMPPNLAQANTDTDGVMYGVANKSYCSGNLSDSVGGKSVETIDYTPHNFNSWVKDIDDKNDDDVEEYAVTEISGIDWGVTGPNQGPTKPDVLFRPGGHFLGIACMNSEVDIKSCVNLSRICEIGALMSQRQDENRIMTYDGYSETAEDHIIPSGFISKNEMGEGNFKTVFASLNHNNLKVIEDHNTTINRYDFINIQPINFNGELRDLVFPNTNSTPYNVTRRDIYNDKDSQYLESDIAYYRTFEETSRDYYNFRLGLHSNNEAEVRKRYLWEDGEKVSLPVYENSFYFYFGMVDGSTAIDKFLTNYYSECPVKNMGDEPVIESVVITDAILCGDRGRVTIVTSNVPTPYEWVLMSGVKIIRNSDFCITNVIDIGEVRGESNDIVKSGLEPGSYTIVVKNENSNISLSREFEIYENLPTDDTIHNLTNESLDITFKDYTFEPNVTYTEELENDGIEVERVVFGVKVEHALESDTRDSIIINHLNGYDGEKKEGPYIVGISIDDGFYYSFKNLSGVNLISKNIKNLFYKEGYVFLEKYELKVNNRVITDVFEDVKKDNVSNVFRGSIHHWGENKYNIRIIYSCKPINTFPYEVDLKLYEIIDGRTIQSSHNLYEFWMYDEENNFSQIDDALVIEENTVKIKPENIEELNMPLREWMIKKTIISDESIYSLNSNNISLGVTNYVSPYVEEIDGDIERRVDSKILILRGDKDNERRERPTLSNIIIPTKAWMIPYKDEFDGLAELSELPDDNKEKQDYIYKVKDGNGFYCLYGELYKKNDDDRTKKTYAKKISDKLEW